MHAGWCPMTYCAWCMGPHAWCTLASKLVSIRGLRCSLIHRGSRLTRMQRLWGNLRGLSSGECSCHHHWTEWCMLVLVSQMPHGGFGGSRELGAAFLWRRTKFTSCCASALGRGTKCCASRVATLLCLGGGARRRCTCRSVVSPCMPYLVRPFAAILHPCHYFRCSLHVQTGIRLQSTRLSLTIVRQHCSACTPSRGRNSQSTAAGSRAGRGDLQIHDSDHCKS